jgi:hypothetical protein
VPPSTDDESYNANVQQDEIANAMWEDYQDVLERCMGEDNDNVEEYLCNIDDEEGSVEDSGSDNIYNNNSKGSSNNSK